MVYGDAPKLNTLCLTFIFGYLDVMQSHVAKIIFDMPGGLAPPCCLVIVNYLNNVDKSNDKSKMKILLIIIIIILIIMNIMILMIIIIMIPLL